MQSPKVTRQLMVALLLICGLQAVWIFLFRPSLPELSRVIAHYPLGTEGTVYVVMSDVGGATVPLIYRFYISVPMNDDVTALQTLRKQDNAFLVTRDPQARVDVSGHRISVSVRDTVYRYSSTALLPTPQGYTVFTVSLNAQVSQAGSVPSS